MSKLLMSAVAAAFATIGVAACGSSSSSSSGAPSAASAPNAAPASSTSSPHAATGSAAAVVSAKQSKIGTILAGPAKRKTLYMFLKDKGSSSACNGACALAWPPLTTSAKPTAGSGANGADLATITRADGTTQVAYGGHPLYYFSKDGDAGDAYGEGSKAFGGEWYAVSPAGKKVEKKGS
ncbi:MAG: COG4315 family predicted lipoprotein [Solirubrobacteraceae bacterium]